MKIICYLPTPGGLSGAPRRLLTLAASFAKHGLFPYIATNNKNKLAQAAMQKDVSVINFPDVGVLARNKLSPYRLGLFTSIKAIVDLLHQNIAFYSVVKKNDFDVIWIRSSKGIALVGLGAFLTRKPIIWDVDYEPSSRGIVRWLHSFALYVSTAVIFQYNKAPTKIFDSKTASKFKGKFLSIIPGIDFHSLNEAKVEHDGRTDTINPSFTILQVGAVCDRKNQFFSLRILRDLKLPNGINLKFIFAGTVFDPNYYKALTQFSVDNNLSTHVEFLGWRDDVHQLMAQADLLLMPSKDEGVPNVVQEAMYIGLPVIVSDAGGMPEIIVQGETGWVLPTDSTEPWVKQVSDCIVNRKIVTRVSKFSHKYALENFETTAWAVRYSLALKKAMKSRR